MGITTTFSEPYFTGGSISSLVPSIYPIALNGRPYMLDTLPETYYVRWNIESIPMLRQQADQSKAPAEGTLNPAGFWRRAQDSFHHGAGQVYRDRDDNADAYRFRSSKGINVWTRYQMSLLNSTSSKLSSSNTNIKVVTAGAYIYYCDGSVVKRTTSLSGTPSYTSITYAGGAVSDICSDGFNVYVTDGSNIYVSPTSGTTLTSTDTTDATICAYVKARFMCAKNNILYNIPTLGSATNVMTFTHPNSGFTWVGFAEGTANIFAAGYAGDKSLIYRIAIKQDASALDAPIVAGELPDGETIASISGYLGNIWLGTSRGWRFCQVDAQGNLDIGVVVETPYPVLAFEPQDRFMWFGYTNYDSVSTGLGRSDFTQATGESGANQIAYASDLMTTGQGAVLSIASFGGKRVFTVSGLGIYAEDSTLVTSGTFDSGLSGFGLPDSKTAIYVHADTDPLVGSYTVALAGTDGTFVEVGSEGDAASTTDNFPANNLVAERFEVRITLTRATTTTGPSFLRWTLKVIPATDDGPSELFHIPIMLYPILDLDGIELPCDVEFERNEISSLRANRNVIAYQQFNTTYTGMVVDFKEYPYGLVRDKSGNWAMKSTLLVDFQRIS